MPSPPTPIAGVARPCIVAAGVDVVVVAVVVVVVSLLLILRRVSPAIPCRVPLPIATGALQLLALSIVMEPALVALGKITGIRSRSRPGNRVVFGLACHGLAGWRVKICQPKHEPFKYTGHGLACHGLAGLEHKPIYDPRTHLFIWVHRLAGLWVRFGFHCYQNPKTSCSLHCQIFEPWKEVWCSFCAL